MGFKMKGSAFYGHGSQHTSSKNPPGKMLGEGEGGDTPNKFLGKLGGKLKGAMKKGGAGALIGGALLGPLGAAAGAALQRRRNKKKDAAAVDPNAAAVPGVEEAVAAQQAAADPAAAAAVDPKAAAAPPVTMKSPMKDKGAHHARGGKHPQGNPNLGTYYPSKKSGGKKARTMTKNIKSVTMTKNIKSVNKPKK